MKIFLSNKSVAAKASPYICGNERSDLCLTEKLLIAKADPRTLLNKRSDIDLYVITKLSICFKVNLHSTVAWILRNSLPEADVIV